LVYQNRSALIGAKNGNCDKIHRTNLKWGGRYQSKQNLRTEPKTIMNGLVLNEEKSWWKRCWFD
jgi:hypothetical protein